MQWPCQNANKHVHCLAVLGPALAPWVQSSDSQTHDLLACGQLTGPGQVTDSAWQKKSLFYLVTWRTNTTCVSRVVISTTRTLHKLLQACNVYITLSWFKAPGKSICEYLTVALYHFFCVKMTLQQVVVNVGKFLERLGHRIVS